MCVSTCLEGMDSHKESPNAAYQISYEKYHDHKRISIFSSANVINYIQ